MAHYAAMNRIDLRKLANYEEDFALWSAEQAALLRAGQLERIDAVNLAEEVESLGNSNRREIESRLSVLLIHLLKWHYQPQSRSGSWRATINEQRKRIARVIKDSPSLRAYPAEVLAEEYEIARERAAVETTIYLDLFPESCPYTIEQILDPGFLPE
jgi:hypothetical protein